MKYRPEIDGLRCIAVLAVILFHAGFANFSGGFVGVDIFFVISGYLITSLLIEDLEKGRFNLLNFYERRARRILPALFAVLLVTLIVSFYLMIPSDFKYFNQSLVSVILYVSNVFFWKTTSYFGAESDLKPLLHTWSLSVEEQFYIFFPLILWVVWRYWRSKLTFILGLGIFSGIALSQFTASAYPTAGFFLLPTRAWELLAGSVVAIDFFEKKNSPLSNIAQKGQYLSLLGVIFVGFSLFNFTSKTPFPSIFAAIPVLGTALIIRFSHPSNIVGAFLSNKVFVGIGLISYSLYLWHQPIYALARQGKELIATDYLFLILLSFVLAYLTYKFIETPFRNRQKVTRSHIFAFSAISSVFLVSASILPINYPRLLYGDDRFTKSEEVKRLMIPAEGLSKDCEISVDSISKCQTSDNPEILVWGDSHAMHLVEGKVDPEFETLI